MSGTPIEKYVRLELPPSSVRDSLMRVMRAVGSQEAPFRELSLSVDLHLPGRGQVRVPVRAEVVNRPGRWESGLRIEAAQNEHLFPTFEGTLSITPDGKSEAELWLQGTYVPPGGTVGKGLDVTLLRGVAEQSLGEFLAWLAQEIKEDVRRSEREHLEQVRRLHG